MSKDLTDCEIILTNYKWDHWYPHYVEYRKSRDEKFEYSITLTPKKKDSLCLIGLKIIKLIFAFQLKKHLYIITISYRSKL